MKVKFNLNASDKCRC